MLEEPKDTRQRLRTTPGTTNDDGGQHPSTVLSAFAFVNDNSSSAFVQNIRGEAGIGDRILVKCACVLGVVLYELSPRQRHVDFDYRGKK
jgi:hypothetical protein